MHGELIFRHAENGEELRIPGNATLEREDEIVWEFHDRDLSEERVRELTATLEGLRGRGESVLLSFVPASPPLEEVESGPEIDASHSGPIEYEVVEVEGDGSVRLRKAVP